MCSLLLGRGSSFCSVAQRTQPDPNGFSIASYSAVMRKSAKRGQPQIFLLCVTFSASSGGVLSARAFAVPSPNGIGRKEKRAILASTHIGRGVEAFLFPQRKRDTRNEAAKKPSHVHNFGLSDGRPPSWNARVGTRWRLEHFTAGSMPNDRCPRIRHVWGTRQSRWFRGPAALLCELGLFVLAVTSRKIDPRSDTRASDLKRPVTVPHTAERRKLRPRPARVSGPSFYLVR
jgi:hypothetical protein